ncbi:MAG: hypothetical protein JNM26_04150, partial [Ideonella sp.]|nr:hypothetical protein [Ideonella sp.]
GARRFNIKWARVILENCRAYGVPAFMKQLGSNPRNGPYRERVLDPKGGDIAEFPADIRVREWPRAT